MRFTRLCSLVLFASLFAACGESDPADVSTDGGSLPSEADEAREAAFLDSSGAVTGTAFVDGSGEARAVLRLATRLGEVELGESGVGLGPRAVLALVATRAGDDGREGTADDLRFRRLSELDAVPYIGPRSWALLLARAEAEGLVAKLDPCGRGAPRDGLAGLPGDVVDAAPDVRRVVATDRLEVWARAGSAPSADQLEAFRARSCDAFQFDLDTLEREPDEPALVVMPIRVVVLDDAAYGRATGAPGTYGVTFGATASEGDAFVVPVGALRDLAELDDTLAHELAHVFQFRLAPFDAEIPWYFMEGTAIALGSTFGKARHGYATGFVTGWMRTATGEDARLTFRRYGLEDLTQNLSEVGHDQAVSGFFVEFLRAKLVTPAGTGVPQIQARLMETMEAVSAGESLAAAFAQHTGGASLSAAQEAFIGHLDATVGDWSRRAEGTIFSE